MPAPPTVLPQQFGRYRIVGKIGEGGMGTVYRAVDGDLQRDIALKVPHFGPDEDSSVIERFYREARLAGRIADPNICPVYDVGQVDGIHYLTMPYIEGVALSKSVSSDNPWPPERAAELAVQVARAVHVLHLQGIIHRDLKPSNILMRFESEPVLMDFGLARPVRAEGTALTVTGAIMGTPAYMSPEQVSSAADELGPATDIYSIGVLLYELLTGKRPFYGPIAVLYAQILRVAPSPPSGLRPGLDPRLDAICLKAMSKRPSDRFRTAEELANALNAYLGRDDSPLPLPQLIADTVETRTACPHCGKLLRVPETLKGKRLKCPHCRTRLVTDSPQDMVPTRPPSKEQTVRPPAKVAGPKESLAEPRRSIVWPILSLLFVAAIVVGLIVSPRKVSDLMQLQCVEVVHLRPAGTTTTKVKITRAKPSGAVKIRMDDLPDLSCDPVEVKEGEAEAVLTIHASPRAMPGQRWVTIKATSRTSQATTQIAIMVDKPAR